MSYNCHAEYLGDGRLTIDQATLDEFEERHTAECSIVNEQSHCLRALDDGRLEIVQFWWSGEGSGRGTEVLEKEILPRTKGTADILFTWEGGDSFSGLRVIDGRVIECDVVQALRPRVQP